MHYKEIEYPWKEIHPCIKMFPQKFSKAANIRFWKTQVNLAARPKTHCVLPIHLYPHYTPLTITDLCIVSTVLPFPVCHIVVIIQYVAFSVGLFHLIIRI